MARKLPAKLPTVVYGLNGPIKVKLVKDLKSPFANEAHEDIWGVAIYPDREIRIEADALGAKDLAFAWRIFYHEVGHFFLEESGLGAAMTRAEKEKFCESYATHRVAEMQKLR